MASLTASHDFSGVSSTPVTIERTVPQLAQTGAGHLPLAAVALLAVLLLTRQTRRD